MPNTVMKKAVLLRTRDRREGWVGDRSVDAVRAAPGWSIGRLLQAGLVLNDYENDLQELI
jgi:hypothetical protein